jgi:hypothetical protein
MIDFNPILEISQNELEDDQHNCILCNHNINDHNYTFKINCDRLQLVSYCQCNPYIHPDCVALWLSKSSTCPVCRITITPMDNIATISTSNEYNNCIRFFLVCSIGIIIIYCILTFVYWIRDN